MAMLLSIATVAFAKDRNTDYITPPSTLSPNYRYGVLVPVFHVETAQEPDDRKNKVIEVRTGRVIAVISGEPGYNRSLNWHEIAPTRWSEDSSLLLWKVNGKWNPDALVLLRIKNNRATCQVDILKTAQHAILALTRKVAPEEYAAAKKANAGSGSAFPDGFTINLFTDGENGTTVSFPLIIHADLTANPKSIERFTANLDSYLDAVITTDCRFIVDDFHLGKRSR